MRSESRNSVLETALALVITQTLRALLVSVAALCALGDSQREPIAAAGVSDFPHSLLPAVSHS